ncbi:Retrovirus-related Pol polyprotein from transposon 17.6, partial [Mucuna pruriens]
MEQEDKLLHVLREHKKAIGWKLFDLLGINHSIYMPRILMEEEARPIRQQQRRLNPTILDIVKKEVTKLLAVGIIYSISDSQSHKTTITCPFVTFAYSRMSFGRCNVPSTFQRCMISILSDLLQDCMEVFMDNFTVYANSFDACSENLSKILTRCINTNPILNFEKCHFMVIEGIELGHLVSNRGIEVDKSKIDIITSPPNPAFVPEIRSFLGHAGFYRRFIKNFSKIALPLSTQVQKYVDFKFNKPCVKAFKELTNRLTFAPILQAPN